MDTSIALSQGRRRRRIHSAEFKAHIVATCSKPGVSSAAVAMANGINANLVRRWVKEAEIDTETEPGSAAGEPEACGAHWPQVLAVVAAASRIGASGFRHPYRVAARRDDRHGDLAGEFRQ